MEIYSDNYQPHLGMGLAHEAGVALQLERDGFFFFLLQQREKKSQSLRADSKFAHQPLSFQCEVKLSNISRSGPLKVALLSKAQCAMQPKCNNVQTHAMFFFFFVYFHVPPNLLRTEIIMRIRNSTCSL